MKGFGGEKKEETKNTSLPQLTFGKTEEETQNEEIKPFTFEMSNNTSNYYYNPNEINQFNFGVNNMMDKPPVFKKESTFTQHNPNKRNYRNESKTNRGSNKHPNLNLKTEFTFNQQKQEFNTSPTCNPLNNSNNMNGNNFNSNMNNLHSNNTSLHQINPNLKSEFPLNPSTVNKTYLEFMRCIQSNQFNPQIKQECTINPNQSNPTNQKSDLSIVSQPPIEVRLRTNGDKRCFKVKVQLRNVRESAEIGVEIIYSKDRLRNLYQRVDRQEILGGTKKVKIESDGAATFKNLCIWEASKKHEER